MNSAGEQSLEGEREQRPRRRRSSRRRREFHPGAVFLVDKPSGPTSHDVVSQIRRWTGLRRVGHGGTLDPLATGLLPVFVGVATRLNEYLSPYRKSYQATVLLGTSTDTDDGEGEVISCAPVPELSAQQIDSALEAFRGQISQTPPRFSAVKRDGVAAHRAARAGEPLELEPREVTVHELTLTAVDLPQVELSMTVSTGTYVRAIARDLGDALGIGGHVLAMRRTAIGAVAAQDGHTLTTLAEAAERDEIWSCSRSPAALFEDWPQFRLEGEQLMRVRRGQAIRHRPVPGQSRAMALDGDGHVVAVLRHDRLAVGRWEPEKVLAGS